MRILFISSAKNRRVPFLDGSTRYRCYHPAEDLRQMGYIADICTLRSFSKRYIDLYDVFIFSRPRYGRKLLNIVNKLTQVGRKIIADYDDLLFNPELAEYAPHVLMGLTSPHIVATRFSEYQHALSLFPEVIVATKPLADAVEKIHPNSKVHIIHNGLSQYWVNNGKQFFSSESSPIIGYFPGTHSHNHDFKLIEKSLAWHLHRYPNTRLMIVGSLDFDIKSFPKHQLMRHTGVEYYRLPALIKSCKLTIAPLENNPFNKCKSGLKFFESAIHGVPIISSPIPDMQRFKKSGIELAIDHTDWIESLNKLGNHNNDLSYKKSIKEYAENHCMSMKQTKRLTHIISKKSSHIQYEHPDTSNPQAA